MSSCKKYKNGSGDDAFLQLVLVLAESRLPGAQLPRPFFGWVEPWLNQRKKAVNILTIVPDKLICKILARMDKLKL